MQFLSVSSRFCTRASSAQVLASLHLPSASGYSCHMRQVRYSHRGLTPHKFMPMLGAHLALNLAPFGRWTALKRRRLALRYAA